MGVLSSKAIKRAKKKGEIVIDRFHEERLGEVSYDLGLGEIIWVPRIPIDGQVVFLDNPKNVWEGPLKAKSIKEWREETGLKIPSNFDRRGFVILAEQLFLGHTEEFIGSASKKYTTKIFSRSTAKRWGLEVVSDAGVGNPGYINRWTLELKNQNHYPIFLPAGALIAQIQFLRAEKPVNIRPTVYQSGDSLGELKKKWRPEDMLPKPLL